MYIVGWAGGVDDDAWMREKGLSVGDTQLKGIVEKGKVREGE